MTKLVFGTAFENSLDLIGGQKLPNIIVKYLSAGENEEIIIKGMIYFLITENYFQVLCSVQVPQFKFRH